MNYDKLFFGMVLIAMLGLSVGCSSEKPPEISYYVDPGIRNVSRVVFVEIGDQTGYPEVANRMTKALAEAMTDRGIFRVDVLPAGHPELRYLDLHKRGPHTLKELLTIRKSLRCDAILFGRMVSYKQYPSTQIGLYMRLIDLKDGKLIWALDEIWDTTNRQTVKRIDAFYFDYMRDTYDPAKGEMGIMSTDGFQKFVSHEIACTMDSSQYSASRPKFLFSRPVRKFGQKHKQIFENIEADY